jgi:spore maturation protein CgeB
VKILVVGNFYPEAFGLHIAETLERMGHTVRRFEPGFRPGRFGGRIGHRLDQAMGVVHAATDGIPAVRAARTRGLRAVAEEGPIDAAVVCHDFLWPAEVAELRRRTGASVAMWFPDHLANFGRGYFMAAPYDALFFKDPYIVRALEGTVASPVRYLPECFNPERHRMPDGGRGDEAYRCDVATAGNLHSWRVSVFSHLSDFDVKIWGAPPPLWMDAGPVRAMHQGRSVLNGEKALAFRGAKIVLNSLHYGEIWGVNARAFEAAGVGAFQVIDRRPGLAQLFEDGKELVSFRGIADLREKIGRWLPLEAERRAVAEAGMRRAHAEHTYELRLRLLLDTLAGRERGYPVPDVGWGND